MMKDYFFIRRMKFSFVISIIITLIGFLSLLLMPVNRLPDITPTQIVIDTMYPGASSEVVEKMVTNIIEEKVNGIENILFIQSSSLNGGGCRVTITFGQEANSDLALVEVQNRVAEAQPFLPNEVRNIGVSVRKRSTNILLGINLASTNAQHDDIYLTNYADLKLKSALNRVKGVGEAEVFGSKNYSMRIWMNPDKMFALGVTVSDVISSLKQQNVSVAAGDVGSGPNSDKPLIYTVKSSELLSNVSDFESIIIRRNPDMSLIYLKDIAEVNLGSESYSSVSKIDGKATSFMMIYSNPDANALDAAKLVKAEMETLSKRFPDGMEYDIKFDTTTFIKVSLYELIKTIIEATILVIAVVFLFLQSWRATLVPIIAIPISLIGTFGILHYMGFSINTISLFGLVLAVGLVVDDAIIVIENVDRLITKEKLSPLEAAKKSMDQITSPVIATTLVLLAVFVPVSLMPGMVGGIYREFAVTISAALLISMINALTMSPVLCAILLPKTGIKHISWLVKFDTLLEATSNKYIDLLRKALHKYSRLIMLLLVIVVLSGFIYTKNPKGFMPSEDMGFFITEIQLPNASSNIKTEQYLEQIYEKFKQIPKVDSVITLSGFGFISGKGHNKGSIITVLKHWDQRKEAEFSQDVLMNIARQKLNEIPGMLGVVFGFPTIPGLGNADGFSFMLKDSELQPIQALSATARNFIGLANQQPEIGYAFSAWSANEPQYQIKINYEKAKTLGVPLEEINATLRSQFASLYVDDFSKFGKTYKVIIQADSKFRGDVDSLNNFYVRNYLGKMVPVSEIITFSEDIGTQVIEHYNLDRSVSITGAAAFGYSSGDVIVAMERLAKNLGEGFNHEWSGQSLEEILTKNLSTIIFLLSLIFAYLFLVAQYESWSLPLAVLLVIPFAFFGTMVGIYCIKFIIPSLANDIYAQIGMLLLIGLSAKMAILIIDFAIQQRKLGVDIFDAAINAAKMRFRAVMMTSLALIAGLFPLILSFGAGANSRRIIGVTVCSGMFFATLFGLIIIPAAFYLVEKSTTRNNESVE